jgi:hypothetical protein
MESCNLVMVLDHLARLAAGIGCIVSIKDIICFSVCSQSYANCGSSQAVLICPVLQFSSNLDAYASCADLSM